MRRRFLRIERPPSSLRRELGSLGGWWETDGRAREEGDARVRATTLRAMETDSQTLASLYQLTLRSSSPRRSTPSLAVEHNMGSLDVGSAASTQ